jgi:RNA polymerase sigma-70 factor, ECF subfamily
MHSAGLLRPLDFPEDHHHQADDDALVTAAQSGSESAFRELCRRNRGRVFRSISRIARDHADAEDALQDSLMRAFVHLHQFDRRSSFSSWLTRIGINSALMILRKKRRSSETSLDILDGDENVWRQWDVADEAANPEDHCLLNEMTRTINRAICRLPSPLRTVAELRLFQHLALGEIAGTLNISMAATKARLLRAKRRIAGTLQSNANSRSRRRRN